MVLNPCWWMLLLLQVVIWSHGPQPMLVDAAAAVVGNMESWS